MAGNSLLNVSNLKRVVKLGFKSIWLHRLRSLLTMLGMVFGVASVIAMLAVGQGASQAAQDEIRKQGSHNIMIRSVKPPEADQGAAEQTYMIEYGLTHDDLQRIRATIPTVEVVVPGRVIRKKVWNVGHRTDCDVVGTVPWYPRMRNHAITAGRYFTDAEMAAQKNVCVLGAELLPDLFPLEAAIGKAVRIDQEYYRVVGVMEPVGSPFAASVGSAPGEASQGSVKRLYIPMTTANARFPEIQVKRTSGSTEVERVELHEVTVKVAELDKVVETSLIIEDLLDMGHDEQDYEIIVPLNLLEAARRTARIFNIVLGAIAAISLLVGGIGIMNIMLASVTERTREIGIRRALGAKRRDIVLQFLVEALILSGTGGAMGVLVGVGIPKLIEFVAKQATVITPWSPIVAFSISAIIGVMFGIYPALRAANMDPVEALRHE